MSAMVAPRKASSDTRRDGSFSTDGAAMALELGVPGSTGEGNYVADVLHAGEVHEHSLKAHTEAGVLHAAEAAQVQIPPVGLFFETVGGHFANALEKDVVALFALAAADDFAE